MRTENPLLRKEIRRDAVNLAIKVGVWKDPLYFSSEKKSLQTGKKRLETYARENKDTGFTTL